MFLVNQEKITFIKRKMVYASYLCKTFIGGGPRKGLSQLSVQIASNMGMQLN
jgi:hypothetical protein